MKYSSMRAPTLAGLAQSGVRVGLRVKLNNGLAAPRLNRPRCRRRKLPYRVPSAAGRTLAGGQLSSDLLVGPRIAVSFGVELEDGLVDGAIEVIRAGEGLGSEMMPLQVAPEDLDVVQLWSIFRQPLDREPVGALGEGGP